MEGWGRQGQSALLLDQTAAPGTEEALQEKTAEDGEFRKGVEGTELGEWGRKVWSG